jgi:3-deoxy-D-manno-octulosonic-acid transferase
VIYSVGLFAWLVAASPFYLLRAARGRYRGSVRERLGLDLPPATTGPSVWLHACSVGEVEAARPLLDLLRRERPGHALIVSTGTETGQTRAKALFPFATVRYLPFDFLSCIRRHLDTAGDLREFFIMETEIWPNLITELHARGVPVFIANGRISDRAWPRYRATAALFRPVLARIAAVAARTALDAERFAHIGARRVRVTGNIKFDRPAAPPPANLPSGRFVLFASTHPGEDELCWKVFLDLQKEFADLRCILAPRHIDRAAGLRALAPSSLRSKGWGDEPLLILDTHGELSGIFACADAAFIGGSLVPVGGHNPLEAAVHGVPVVWGPHIANFRDACDALRGRGGFDARDANEVESILRRLLSNPAERANAGSTAKAAVEENRGAVERMWEVFCGREPQDPVRPVMGSATSVRHGRAEKTAHPEPVDG